MSSQRSGGLLIIIGTFIIGFMLSQIPLPPYFEWWRPEWVALFVIYWVMALPQKFGVGSAWIVGLLLDVLKGSTLGINAISLTLIAYITLVLHKRLRMYPPVQQAFVVFGLISINQLIFYWFQALTGTVAENFHFMQPAIPSAVLWPWVFVLFRGIRRTFKIS